MTNVRTTGNIGAALTVDSAGGGTGNGVMNWGASGQATTGLYADLSAATAATINQIRQAFQIQRLLERDARGGTRYTEIVRSHFGVISPDARLQRAEYLGGERPQSSSIPWHKPAGRAKPDKQPPGQPGRRGHRGSQ